MKLGRSPFSSGRSGRAPYDPGNREGSIASNPPPALTRTWDFVVGLAATVGAVVAPGTFVLDVPVDGSLLAVEWVITAILSIDAALRIRSLQTSSSRDRRSWMLVIADVLAALPIAPIGGARNPLHLLRLLKLARVAQFMHEWRYRTVERANLLRLGFFLYWMALTMHWITAGWIELAATDVGGDLWDRYLDGLYWTVTTLSTVGFGDITPETSTQKVFAIGVMLLGIGFYGFIIGNVATILVNLDPARAVHQQRMEQLVAFMNHREVPSDLRDRSVEYYRHLWRTRRDHDESEVLTWLPPGLRTEIALFLNRDVIRSVPLFRDASDAFVRDIALELRPVMLMPGDYVVQAGDRARSMYFVSSGELEVLSADGSTVLRTLAKGDFFGEVALVFGETRSASVRAVTYCDIYRLDRELFEETLEDYPDIAAQIRAKAAERREHR
jgi:voltage-gated potassium channel